MKVFFNKHHKINVTNEVQAGIVSYLTISYIAILNPIILMQTGMATADLFLSTCMIVGICCILIGLTTNTPITIGPTMALNTLFLQHVAAGTAWQHELGMVFIAGIILYILAKLGIKELIKKSIPDSINNAIVYGIGLFLLVIAVKFSGAVEFNAGNINIAYEPLLIFLLTTVLVIFLEHKKITGAAGIAIVTTGILNYYLHNMNIATLISIPTILPQNFFALQIPNMLTVTAISNLFTIIIIAVFDISSSLDVLIQQLHHKTSIARQKKVIQHIGTSNIISALLGGSCIGIYLESLSGVYAEGKTGLTACIVGILFFLTIIFAPILTLVPKAATTAILFVVAINIIRRIGFLKKLAPADLIVNLITIITIPMTFSIANGLGIAIISHIIMSCIFKHKVKLHTYYLGCIFVLFFLLQIL